MAVAADDSESLNLNTWPYVPLRQQWRVKGIAYRVKYHKVTLHAAEGIFICTPSCESKNDLSRSTLRYFPKHPTYSPASMVNFRDPAVIAQDARAYSLTVILCVLRHSHNSPFGSGGHEAVAHHRRPLHVSSSGRTGLLFPTIMPI
jgi:hypothetical protein